MAKKWVAFRLDENLLEAVMNIEKNAESRTDAIERRLRKSLL